MKFLLLAPLGLVALLGLNWAMAVAEGPPPVDVHHKEIAVLVGTELVYMDIAYVGPEPEVVAQNSPFVLHSLKRTSPVEVWYNPAGAPASVPEGQVRDGHLGWNGISVNFSFAYAGQTSAPVTSSICSSGNYNGVNTVHWLDLPPNVLGRACWVTQADECDIQIDPNWNWGEGVDAQTVMLHEAGHCAGLAHSASPPAVMEASYAGVRRSPLPDDRAGICAKYSCPLPPTPTPTPTSTPQPTLVPRGYAPGVTRD